MLHSGKAPAVLVVEVGNTTTTFAVFFDGLVADTVTISTDRLLVPDQLKELLNPLWAAYPGMRDAVLCSVVPGISAPVAALLAQLLPGTVMQVSSRLDLPFLLQYESPESFGADRIALCAAGRELFPGRAFIALDIGTAITFDVLEGSGVYLGGFIMPGLDLRARSLHERTAQLPLVSIAPPEELLGRSTAECIRNGIFWGCIAEIDGLTARIMRTLLQRGEEAPAVMATGGNASSIAPLLQVSPLLVEHAVARGAHALYQLNSRSL
ncbi:MAG: type III pantothenate kinase [Chlorobi bacterium]|nr:type III pantothenate kinase [Chlorobiota bacterium]